jgi:hypothetical protein
MPSESKALRVSLRRPAVLKQAKTKATRRGELEEIIAFLEIRIDAFKKMSQAETVDTFGTEASKDAKVKELTLDLADLRTLLSGKDKKRGVSKN